MGDRILIVDDEPAFLTGYQLMLPQNWNVDTAVGGEPGLATIQSGGPYAVVISDMRMPGMNGVEFLTRVRQAAPDTVRMLLTGLSDADTLMSAVNRGNIFRYLAKPCEQDTLAEAVTSGLLQYQSLRSEKELLENTLMGSIEALTDVMSSVCPEAFARSCRIARYVRHFVSEFRMPSRWCFEAAAMLSQLGCINLEPELIQAAYFGTHLSAEERGRFEAHPSMAIDLLKNVKKLEPVAWMIGQQLGGRTPQKPPHTPELPEDMLVLGAKMLRVASAFDNLRMRGVSIEEAALQLRYRSEFDRKLVDTLATLKPEESKLELRRVSISAITVGTILQQNVRNHAGVLIVAKGQAVTRPLIAKLEHFSQARLIDKDVMALVPV
jgi:response regulator RpfG family c-di-GMP phosphodiesterase